MSRTDDVETLLAGDDLTPSEVEAQRVLTPGCSHVNHLNNAGAGLAPRGVTDAVVDHLRLEAQVGGYEAAARAHDEVEHVYDAASALLRCERDEVAFVENATRAWDMAFYGLRLRDGDTILTSRSEYASNMIAFLHRAARSGVRVVAVDDDEHGQIDLADLERRIDHRTALVALTHVPTQGGLVNPAAEVGEVTRRAGVPYLLDACQSAGQLDLDVTTLGCDFLSITGRKYLRGPRGTGLLYVSRDWTERIDPPFLDLHAATWTGPQSYEVRADARRLENWETNVAGKIGLGVAIDHALGLGLDRIETRVVALGQHLRERLASVPGVDVHDQGERRCAIVTFTVTGVPSAQVQADLATSQINVSVSSREHARLDLVSRDLPDLVRASAHYYNTVEELDALVERVARLTVGASSTLR